MGPVLLLGDVTPVNPSDGLREAIRHERPDPVLPLWVADEGQGGDAGPGWTLPEVRPDAHRAGGGGGPKVEAEPEPEAGAGPRGYGPAAHVPLGSRRRQGHCGGRADRPAQGAGRSGAEAVEPSKVPEVSRDVEPWWRPDVLFPLRGAEGLILVVMLGLATWGVATLLPELCLQFVADAAFFGATLMGVLVSIIVSLPGLAVGLFVVIYSLQYLGRVLVSGAMGEVVPPRPPDRNFDGLFNGLGPWLIWLACGASLGLGPTAAYLLSRTWDEPVRPVVLLLLMGFGLPYALMALLMTFLRDGGFPSPFRVVGALIRFHVGFLAICAVEIGCGLVVVGAFAVVLWLRNQQFWLYLPLMLPCWMLAHWAGIVAMRVLGVFYHGHASILRWHRKKPWWDMTVGN